MEFVRRWFGVALAVAAVAILIFVELVLGHHLRRRSWGYEILLGMVAPGVLYHTLVNRHR